MNKDNGEMGGTIYPYNEYYMVNPFLLASYVATCSLSNTLLQVAYMANLTTEPGSDAAKHFATYMGK